jgi:hypothetical protein
MKLGGWLLEESLLRNLLLNINILCFKLKSFNQLMVLSAT